MITSRPGPLITLVIGLGCLICVMGFADGTEVINSGIVGTWRWIETVTPVEEIRPLVDEDYLLSFSEDGTLNMSLEVNRISSEYGVEGDRITVIPPMMMTLAAWLPGSPAPSFLNLIENSSNYFFEDDYLYIDTSVDGGTLRFRRIM